MNKKIVFVGLFTLLLFLSCNQDDKKEYAFNYINLSFYEQFFDNERTFVFDLETIETYPCLNFRLEVDVISSHGKTDIYAHNIDVPDICLTALGPAQQTLNMGDAENVQSNITFWVNENQHDFHLLVKDEYITFIPGEIDEKHLFFTYDTLRRIPQNTLWGYIRNHNANNSEIIEEILQEFRLNGAEEIFLNDGKYHYFEIKNQNIVFDNLKQPTHGFFYDYDGKLEDLAEIFNQILEDYNNEELQLRMFHTSGERIMM